jgi:2-dehydro-3-deoxyglucarate aldolase
MNRLDKISQIRKALARNQTSIGSWMQTLNTSVAEIMGQAGYDWVTVDMEPGAISVDQLLDCSVR